MSGDWGTLTFGDTDAADQQWVGDVPGNFSLTGLTDVGDTKFISNGGSFGDDMGESFAENPFARPTVRYDLDLERFGFSVSTNRDLTDIAIGAGHQRRARWRQLERRGRLLQLRLVHRAGRRAHRQRCGRRDRRYRDDDAGARFVPSGEQWSIGVEGEYERFTIGVTYTNVTSNSNAFGRLEANDLLVGASATLAPSRSVPSTARC